MQKLQQRKPLRRLIALTEFSKPSLCEASGPADEIIAQAEEGLIDVAKTQIVVVFQKYSFSKSLTLETWKFDRNKRRILRIATGYQDLDHMTTGLHEEELIILAARPALVKLLLP